MCMPATVCALSTSDALRPRRAEGSGLGLLMGELGVDWLTLEESWRERPTGEFGTDWETWCIGRIALVLKLVLNLVLIVGMLGCSGPTRGARRGSTLVVVECRLRDAGLDCERKAGRACGGFLILACRGGAASGLAGEWDEGGGCGTVFVCRPEVLRFRTALTLLLRLLAVLPRD